MIELYRRFEKKPQKNNSIDVWILSDRYLVKIKQYIGTVHVCRSLKTHGRC